MYGRKNTSRTKLKTACQKERLLKGKEHFKNLLGNPPEITNKPNQKIIIDQLDIKLGQFTEEELVSFKKLKTEKLLVSSKFGRQKN